MGKVVVALLPLLAILGLNLHAGAASSDAGYNSGRILELMNAERSARGVRPVARDPSLDQAAQRWATKLAAEGRMYHSTSYAGLSAGYRSAAQNLAWHDDSLTAGAAHDLWMNSGVHRKNLLDPDFSHVGIAMACSAQSGRAYVMAVVEFGGDGSPSSATPSRNPQVGGGSDPGRAMSCDGESAAGTTPAAPPATITTPPAAPATTTAATSNRSPSTSLTRPAPLPASTAAAATAGGLSATTPVRPEAAQATETRATGSAAPGDAQRVGAGTGDPATTTTTSPPPGSIVAELAGARSRAGPPAGWTLLATIGGGLVLFRIANTRSRRPAPRHSVGRKFRS
ncbi:MAG: CAP domain-containing protein [Actinomycetota bacterium]